MDLAIFDFDNTLFQSPVPNRDRLDRKLYGKLMTQPEDKGLGWWQDTITLDPKYTTDIGLGFNGKMVDVASWKLSDPNTVSIVLTGRRETFRKRISELCISEGLFFDNIILKPDVSLSTLDYKKATLELLINTYNPSRIDIWDDREKHCDIFRKFLAGYSDIVSMVYHVKPVEPTLPSDLEDEIIEYLKAKNGYLAESVTKKPAYYAVELTDESRTDLLKGLMLDSSKGNVIADHMTIIGPWNLNKYPEIAEYALNNLGKEVKLTVVAAGQLTGKVLAVKVETDVPSANVNKHITVLVANGAKARESNDIVEWNEIEPFELRGIISAMY